MFSLRSLDGMKGKEGKRALTFLYRARQSFLKPPKKDADKAQDLFMVKIIAEIMGGIIRAMPLKARCVLIVIVSFHNDGITVGSHPDHNFTRTFRDNQETTRQLADCQRLAKKSSVHPSSEQCITDATTS